MISSLTADSVAEPAGPQLLPDARKARMSDIAPVLRLINDYATKGIMLPLTELEISEKVRDFSVIFSGDQLIGCGALHFYTPTMGEIRSLAVDPNWKAQGVGRKLIEVLVEEATEYSLDAIFALTYVPEFFRKLGFEEVERGMLPLKAWKDCLRCPKFSCCDEIAVLKVLSAEHWQGVVSTHQCGGGLPADSGQELIVLPTVRKQPL